MFLKASFQKLNKAKNSKKKKTNKSPGHWRVIRILLEFCVELYHLFFTSLIHLTVFRKTRKRNVIQDFFPHLYTSAWHSSKKRELGEGAFLIVRNMDLFLTFLLINPRYSLPLCYPESPSEWASDILSFILFLLRFSRLPAKTSSSQTAPEVERKDA